MDPTLMSLLAVGGGITKAIGGLFDDRANLMRREAGVKLSTLEEQMRRAEGAQTQVLSSTKARMAGSGFASDSKSFTSYLSGMESEFQKQNVFAKQNGMASIDLMKQAADDMDSAKYLRFASDLLGTATNAAATYKLFG